MANKTNRIISAISVLLVVVSVSFVGLRELSGSHAQSFTTETARPANDFLNSEGVNVHMGSSVYSANPSLVATKLNQLGVRWVRSNAIGATVLSNDAVLGRAGIKLDLLEDYDLYRADKNTLGTKMHDTIKNNILPYTFAVEGINEPDTPSFNQGANWAADSCAAQPLLYSAIKGDPATKNIIVLEPSVTGLSLSTRGPMLTAACNLGSVADYANMHPYPGGWPPEYNNLILSRKASAQTYEGTGPNKPVAFTETGYDTALFNTKTNHPISEAGQAVYMPRIYLQYFAAGIGLTAPYELVDEGTSPTNQEDNFGMYHNNWTPKPAATAVSNMNAILADSVSKPAGSLQYSLSDATVKHLLLQKSDGSFYMALWREGNAGMVWDASLQTPGSKDMSLPGTTGNVSISFPQNMSVTAYVPNTSASPTPQGSVVTNAKSIPVGPGVVILRIASANVLPPTPTPTPAPTPTPGPTAKPDFVVQSIGGFNTTSTHVGDHLIFTAVVKNIGAGASPAGTILGVGFKLDGTEVTWTDNNTSSLAPGASITLTANSGPAKVNYWVAKLGTHTILATVDDVNRIVEANETNNILSQTFVVSPQPPLPVTPGGTIIIGTGSGSSGGSNTTVPGADQPITVISATGKATTVNAFTKPVISGSISLVNPTSAPNGTTTALYIDGKKSDTTPGAAAKIDTTYLSNGHHVLTLVSKKPNGTSVYTSRDFNVTNNLSPYQKLRDSVYRRINNKPVANIVATGTILSPASAPVAVVLAYRHTLFGFFHHHVLRKK